MLDGAHQLASRSLVQFLAAVAEDSARDVYHVDLLIDLEDVIDLRVAHPVAAQNSAHIY